MIKVCFYLLCWWTGVSMLIFILRHRLIKETWNEPYCDAVLFVIESDDWGPGDKTHICALKELLAVLRRHTDAQKKPAVLTANIILTVPDSDKMSQNQYQEYACKTLPDHFTPILIFMRKMYDKGLFFPQLHGLAHYNPEKISALAAADTQNVREWIAETPCEWEQLPHPLQAHYVDGTILPSQPIDRETQQKFIETAVLLFKQAFGFAGKSTVAPCYLWDDTTESIWADAGYRYIQTAGYRCIGLDGQGNYVQRPEIIRPGQKSSSGMLYLVRTVMFEPSDFPDAETTCIRQIKQAVSQGLGVVISTHRYNYAGQNSCLEPSINALDRILSFARKKYNNLCFLHSEALGDILEKNRGCPNRLVKSGMFLYRLWYRHKKLRFISIATLLILPALVIVWGSRLAKRQRSFRWQP